MLILLVSCGRETTDYQATIVSQQGTMIAIMQSSTPTQTPLSNLWRTATPNIEEKTLNIASTLVAIESAESKRSLMPPSSSIVEQDILQSMQQLIELQATALADSENRFKSQTKILYQDARMQATMIKQNRIVITAVIELQTQHNNLQATTISQNDKIITSNIAQEQQNNLQATTISQNDKIITSNIAQEQQNKRIINYNATAVSLSSTAISLAKVQNNFLDDINDALNIHTQLLRKICRNTAETFTEYSACSQ